YFRNDLGIQKIDFVRGGSATMYGMGSVAGIINYTSRFGSSKPQTILETEVASPGKVRMDFNNSGALADKLYYNVSGTYRYDDGPIVTGLSSNGYQIRANIRKELNNGSFTVYAQMIDDRVQFFLPYHLTSARKRPIGWDGKTIMTMQTADVANLTVRTPNGFYRSRAAEGVSTKGGYLMAAFEKELSSGWKIDAKFRTAKYQHQFNFFGVDGSGRNPMTQRIFLDSIAARPPQVPLNAVYSYANDGTVLNANSLVLENNMTDRDRPLNEMAGNFNLSKTFNGNKAVHTFNIGAFVARTEAGDYNVQLRYLSEFKNQPRVLNLRYTDNGVARNYTVNGVRSVAGYTNKFLISNKAALYLTDEIVWGKLRVDLGFRVESIKGTVNAEKTSTALNADGLSVTWGNGSYDKFNVSATDWAGSIAASYQVKRNINVYANFSRGYFFPELRGPRVTYVGGIPAYPVYRPERIIQGEMGVKYSNKKGIATLALFTNQLNDRLNVVFLNVGGSVQEVANILSSRTSGLEATFDWELFKNVRIDGAFTFQAHKYTKDDAAPANVGNWLERQPRIMYNIGATYTNK
ncbi:MAG: TonB-dependent receptor domain-containing protein, partial [Chitinophagaceae bacterium]